MRIIVATFTYSPNVDGVAAAARQMVENFQRAGHDVCVATSPVISPNISERDETTGVRRFNISGSPAVGVGFHGDVLEYQNFLRSFQSDVIVFHCWDTWTAETALPILDEVGAKTVLVSHGYVSHMIEKPRKLPRGVYRWIRWLPHVLALPRQLIAFDRVVFLSGKTDMARFFDARVAKLLRRGNTVVIPNGVEPHAAVPDGNFRTAYALEGRLMLLNIANYSQRKNQMMALDAFCQANVAGSSLVFIGSAFGDYGDMLIEEWHKRKSEYPDLLVIILEDITRADVMAALSECDVFLLSAHAETQPIVLLEAMSAGKPFISTDVGCVTELKGGLIVWNTGEMAAAIRFLAQDPKERSALGKIANADFLAHYSREITDASWLRLVDELNKSPSR